MKEKHNILSTLFGKPKKKASFIGIPDDLAEVAERLGPLVQFYGADKVKRALDAMMETYRKAAEEAGRPLKPS